MAIYAVVRLDNNKEFNSCHIYSKQTSNLGVMKAYYKEIKTKYPHCKVALVTRERAKEIEKEYRKWLDKYLNNMWNRVMCDTVIRTAKETHII